MFHSTGESDMDHATLTRAVELDAALRRRQRLQPVGGKGDKIFPPTYPEERRGQGPRHVFERRRVNGSEVWCVLLDSVQSQANRLEEVLLEAMRQGTIKVPHVTVDFRGAGFARCPAPGLRCNSARQFARWSAFHEE